MNVRAAAARALAPVLRQESSLDAALERELSRVSHADQGLLRELSFGVCRYYFAFDTIITRLLTKPLKAKDSDIKALLLLGAYQILCLRIPDHAAINESVNATKALKKLWAKNLVNALLRQILRERDAILQQINSHSMHPSWLEKTLQQAWPEHAADIFSANNQQAPLTLRANRRQTTRAEYRLRLEGMDVSAEFCQFSADGLRLEQGCDVTNLPGFADGSFSVQDEAAQLSAHLLALEPGLRVLDACCAPGGKTCHIAESQPQLAELVALDQDAERLERVVTNLQRLRLQAKVIRAAAQDLDAWWDGRSFERILLDAPCSATGVIRRHPDIKLLRRESDIAQLCRLQANLLEQLWQTLSPGGILLYATCSILPQENEDQLKAFVERQPEALHLPINANWGEARPYGRQLFPQPRGHDGFYYALLQKRR